MNSFKKFLKSKFFILFLGACITTLTFGCIVNAQSNVSSVSGVKTLADTINVSGNLNVGLSDKEDANFGGLIQNGNPIFTEGIRVGESMTQVVDSTGKIVADINSANASLSGTLAVAGETQLKRLISGGLITEIATSGAETLSAEQLCNSRTIAITMNHSAANITLPASTTLAAGCLWEVGKNLEVFISNASLLLGSSTTITTGAGITLASSTGPVLGGGQYGYLKIERVRETGKEFIASIIKVTD